MSSAGNVNGDGELVTKPFLSIKMAGELLWKLYGLQARRTVELPSYGDQNFYVTAAGGGEERDHADRKFVLKVINSEDSLHLAGCYEEIVSVLVSLRQGRDGVVYPAPIENCRGGYLSLEKYYRETDGACGMFLVMLLSYVPGIVLSEVLLSNQVLFSVGRAVANLNRQLLEFKGVSESLKERAKTNKWCLTSVDEVRQYLDGEPDENHRQLAASVLDRFARDVKPLEKGMQKGIIHVDVNRNNILVTPIFESTNQKPNKNGDIHALDQPATHSISGIIDFSDMAYECLLYDIAGSLMDMMIGRKDKEPLVAAGHFLAGYISVIPLSTAEWQSIYVATAARLVQILVLSYDNFHQSGDSDEYIMRMVHSGGWEVLKEFWGTPKRKVEALWERLSMGQAEA